MKWKILIAVAALLTVLVLSYTVAESLETSLNTETSVFGINLVDSSLFAASIIIGLIDGFNPCAMWVLVYLITLAAQLNDKRKMWFIVGTFLAASGIIYYIILAGWFNLFELMNMQWVIYIVGAFALGMGTYQVIDYLRSDGEVVCDVGDVKSRKKTRLRIDQIMHSPLTLTTIFATIVLAFVINSIEFLCSVGLPAVFAQLLSVADISTAAVYGYNLLYTLAFMFDDLVIFLLALFALDSIDLTKYSGYSKFIGGLIMFLLGVMLIFFPHFLA